MEAIETAATETRADNFYDWQLWGRQVSALLRLELKKTLFSRRAVLLYLLAGLPLFLLALWAVAPKPFIAEEGGELIGKANDIFAALYGGLMLRTVVFFGCAWLFMNLFRGEIVDRSLHYYFLAPVRREVLVAGKYLAGLLAAMLLFGAMTVAAQLLFYLPLGRAASSLYFANGPGFRHLFAYLGMTWLACLGYGAAFLLIGLLFRNPVIPALVAYGWEGINFLLPPLLKKISVTHYLNSLAPVPVPEGPFAVTAEPTPVWLATLGLLLFTAAVLALAGWRARGLEISYGNE
jgi:ABC-type transport system involved in multi-copper enzyme maturation permease subunit